MADRDYTDFRITELWLATSLDDDGEESVCYISPGVYLDIEPLMATDPVRLEEVVRPYVERLRPKDPTVRVRHYRLVEDEA